MGAGLDTASGHAADALADLGVRSDNGFNAPQRYETGLFVFRSPNRQNGRGPLAANEKSANN